MDLFYVVSSRQPAVFEGILRRFVLAALPMQVFKLVVQDPVPELFYLSDTSTACLRRFDNAVNISEESVPPGLVNREVTQMELSCLLPSYVCFYDEIRLRARCVTIV